MYLIVIQAHPSLFYNYQSAVLKHLMLSMSCTISNLCPQGLMLLHVHVCMFELCFMNKNKLNYVYLIPCMYILCMYVTYSYENFLHVLLTCKEGVFCATICTYMYVTVYFYFVYVSQIYMYVHLYVG